ncbi:MAG TPA: hypothetical protein VJ998_12375, partial [Pseudomonadales bacterium]|nr:hypothetical protein [Pseudomonadales bacterium]
PNRLECFVEAWSTDNADGRYAALFTAQRYGDRQSRMVPVIDYDDLLSGNYIGNQVFTLTARLKDIGGFDEALPAMQDYETWLRLTKRYGPVLGLPEATYLVDIDHTLGRVSEKDVATLRAAYAHIVKVHNLDPRAQRRLKSVLFSYPQVPMSLLDLAEQWRLGNYGQSSRTWLAKKLGMQR